MSQLSLFDMENTSTKPLPLVVAEQWGFPLQYHIVGEQYWYAVQDWVNGLIGPDVPKATMSGIMGSVQPNLTKMPYRTPKRGTPPRHTTHGTRYTPHIARSAQHHVLSNVNAQHAPKIGVYANGTI